MEIDYTLDLSQFNLEGYYLEHGFLNRQECERLLSSISEYQEKYTVPVVYRHRQGRSLSYKVIDGKEIQSSLPEIDQLYQDINTIINTSLGTAFTTLKSRQTGVNVNITPPGGEYRWHYDRNEVTAILYLNEVAGGETECYPNYRIYLDNSRYSQLQQGLDYLLEVTRNFFGKQVLIKPQQGSIFFMKGKHCLHSVQPVLGTSERINIIFAYDSPGASFTIENSLNNYLYNQSSDISSDPNYR